MAGWRVVEIAGSDTHALRCVVLRVGMPSTDVVFDGDDDDTTFHLGVVDSGDEVVAVSSWYARSFHGRADGVQLRGMAVRGDVQGSGLGSSLLTEGLDRVTRLGGDLVWARARDTAVGFYVRHGFEVKGEGYVDTTTGLPHHDVVRRLRLPRPAQRYTVLP
jgi:predicted GNAT family N-acyltransferase